MPVIGSKKSVLISKILCYVIFVFLIASIFLIPTVVSLYSSSTDASSAVQSRIIDSDIQTDACVVLYVSVIPAFIADFYLLKLLRNIKKEEIFIRQNVRCLRILAWCCFAVGVIFTAGGFYFSTAFVIAFAAYFFFLIIHVIKNVFDAAVVLKEENDYTI